MGMGAIGGERLAGSQDNNAAPACQTGASRPPVWGDRPYVAKRIGE